MGDRRLGKEGQPQGKVGGPPPSDFFPLACGRAPKAPETQTTWQLQSPFRPPMRTEAPILRGLFP